MRYLTLGEVLELHRRAIVLASGSPELRDLGALESAVSQPRAMFGGRDLYPSIEEKAAALAFSLILNHPFVDGNKRVGHAALETFLVLNGKELNATVGDGERIILAVASSKCSREDFVAWIREHVVLL